MDDKKKKFIKPVAIVVDFVNEDIITYSTGDTYPDDWIGEDWGDE